MTNAFWLAIFVTAAGTLLMRVLPLVWMQRRLARRQTEDSTEIVPSWLRVLGPAMIAAMLGVSLVPTAFTVSGWAAPFVAVLVTLGVWYRTRSLGLPVFAGVLIYGVIKLLGTA